jgi:hypothetical protein
LRELFCRISGCQIAPQGSPQGEWIERCSLLKCSATYVCLQYTYLSSVHAQLNMYTTQCTNLRHPRLRAVINRQSPATSQILKNHLYTVAISLWGSMLTRCKTYDKMYMDEPCSQDAALYSILWGLYIRHISTSYYPNMSAACLVTAQN